MAKKTNIMKEIDERIDYFEDFFKTLSKNSRINKEDVVDDRSAIQYLRLLAELDGSLDNLTDELSRTNNGFKPLLETDFIQDLILENKIRIKEYEDSLKQKYGAKGLKISGDKLDKAVAKLRRKRLKFEKGFPVRNKREEKIVVDTVMTKRFSKQYGYSRTVDKNGVNRYRDSKGRFVKKDTLLKIADKVLIVSKNKRLQVQRQLKKNARGNKKK